MYQFAGYGFGKAHSAAYALLAHQTAYLKTHYPAEFYAATLTAEWREQDKIDRYIRDADARGIEMQPPSINDSAAEFSVTQDGRGVRFGLQGIKNVGEGAVKAILEARAEDGSFKSLFDFCGRIDSRRVNRRVVESLIRCGAFDFQKATRSSLFQALAGSLERAARVQRDRAAGQTSLFGSLPESDEPPLKELPEWPRGECLAAEKEMLGFYVTGHPLLEHAAALEFFSTMPLNRVREEQGGQAVRAAGILSGLSTQKTRRGGLMARARLEDMHGALSAVFFPTVFDRYASQLRTSEPLLLKGTLQLENERAELHVDEVIPLSEAWSRCTSELRVRLDAAVVSSDRLLELRKLLDLEPGDVPVCVQLRLASGAEAVLALRSHRVKVSQDLVRRVDQLFGAKVSECRV